MSPERDVDTAEREREREREPETELIDLARLGAADPERGVAVRDVRDASLDSRADDSDDEDDEDHEDDEDYDYDPGWLGTVLRWPIRVVAVVVIAPFQVAWESVKALGRFAGRGLAKIGRGIGKAARVLGRPFRAVGRAIGWVATRFLWWPVRFAGRGAGWVLVLIGRGVEAFYDVVLTPIGHGIAAMLRAIGSGIGALGRGIGSAAAWFSDTVLAPIGRGIGALAGYVRDGFGWVGWQVYRWVLFPLGVASRAVGRVVIRGLYYLAQPFVLLGRGLWHVLKVLGRWIVGLFRVLVQAFDFAARVGANVGRGVVWLWKRSVWIPIRFVASGFRDAAKWVGRGLRAVAQPIARRVTAVRLWYRHEISEPVKSALRAARRDVRRALFGRGRV
ncbi:MAG: hypothetical protein AUG49_08400 [Catenulispora sp. 13_1_20CM_3_70_7]|nr:MAG: hypothetical protein AUG49_08400 [Catenulispora sp. 13_1_20CM_3_70_7]